MTAKCGFGYQGQCCCECRFHLQAQPKCHHLGGPRQCGCKPEKQTYVCLVFAGDGIAMTEWDEHGSCEGWAPKEKRKRKR